MTAGGIAARGDAPAQQSACRGDNGGLTLSPGFCATIFADNLGHVRHLVAAPDGTLYANTWSGRYFPNAPPPPGGFLIALKDTTGGGRADVVQRFGVAVEAGGTGGSGIALYHDALLRGPILTPAEVPAHCRLLPATPWIRWRSATVSFMARRATAPAADVTARTQAAARSGQRLIQAIGCGATAAFRGSLQRSRAASRIPSNIRASCRHWAALRFRRRTRPRWRHMFGPSAMPESHGASHDLTPPL